MSKSIEIHMCSAVLYDNTSAIEACASDNPADLKSFIVSCDARHGKNIKLFNPEHLSVMQKAWDILHPKKKALAI